MRGDESRNGEQSTGLDPNLIKWLHHAHPAVFRLEHEGWKKELLTVY
jgi:hypothetical protein